MSSPGSLVDPAPGGGGGPGKVMDDARHPSVFKPSMSRQAQRMSVSVKKFPDIRPPRAPEQSVLDASDNKSFFTFFSAFVSESDLSSMGSRERDARDILFGREFVHAPDTLSQYRVHLFGIRVPWVRPTGTQIAILIWGTCSRRG